MPEREAPADDVAGVAVWFNKREVARIDFAAEHTLGPESDGWRVDFHDHGSIRVGLAKGPKETITVVAGDSLLSSNEDFYLTRHAGDDKRRERKERSEAKRSTRKRSGTQGPAKAPAAKGATTKGSDR